MKKKIENSYDLREFDHLMSTHSDDEEDDDDELLELLLEDLLRDFFRFRFNFSNSRRFALSLRSCSFSI